MPWPVLVSGAGGFIGANLVRRLLEEGQETHALVRAQSELWRLEDLRADVQVHAVDIQDERRVGELLRRVRPRWVFHLAAHGAYSWQREERAILAVNLIGTATLAAAAREAEVEALVNAGSSSEYGLKDHAPDELEAVEPNSAYAVGKAAATLHLQMLAREQDRHIVTLRLYSVYGPWEEPNRLMPTLAVRGLRHELPPLVDPRTARDYVAVADVVEAFVASARATSLPRGAVLNVGSGRQTTIAEVVELASSQLQIGVEPKWATMPARSWDTGIWVSDPRRIADQLGWRAQLTLNEGFAELVAWLRAAPPGIRERYERAILGG